MNSTLVQFCKSVDSQDGPTCHSTKIESLVAWQATATDALLGNNRCAGAREVVPVEYLNFAPLTISSRSGKDRPLFSLLAYLYNHVRGGGLHSLAGTGNWVGRGIGYLGYVPQFSGKTHNARYLVTGRGKHKEAQCNIRWV